MPSCYFIQGATINKKDMNFIRNKFNLSLLNNRATFSGDWQVV